MTQTGYKTAVTTRAIRALVIQPDASYEVKEIDQDAATFKQIVGDNIQAVSAGEGAVFFCDEEGKVHGLPRNMMATYLWWKLDETVEGLDDLRGPVIVTGPTDDAGDSYPVMEAVLDLFRRMEALRITRDPRNEVEPPL